MIDLFIDEFVLNIETQKEYPNWRIYFDGAVNVHWNGGAILISLVGAQFPVAIKLRFPYTSNMTEYEACSVSQSRPRHECLGSRTL